jgi:hypothetical protein
VKRHSVFTERSQNGFEFANRQNSVPLTYVRGSVSGWSRRRLQRLGEGD